MPYAYAASNIDNTIEQKYLVNFLQVFFLEEDYSYALFGEKPMSFSGVANKSPESIEKIYHLLPCAMSDEGGLIWQSRSGS